MPSKPPYPHSTRLENLSLDSQGAAFDLEGRPIRLNGEGYAGPVASMQEFYQHALADYYRRSAELSRQAAPRPSLLGRVVSWVGRFFERLNPAPRVAGPFLAAPHPSTPADSSAPRVQPAPRGPNPADPEREAACAVARAPHIAGPRTDRTIGPEHPPAGSGTAQPASKSPATVPPLLHVVFADRDGVHVIWQLAAGRPDPERTGRGTADPKAAPPRLELTYGLDSSMAQRLQDCYGQLAQLGYKVAGLEAIRADPEKAASEKGAPKPAPAAAAAALAAAAGAKSIAEPSPAPRSEPVPRKTAARAIPTPSEAARPAPEPPNPSFLPGI